MNQKANVTVDINSMPAVKCACGSVEFQMKVQLRKISALQSPTGTEGIVNLQTGYICASCKEEFDLFGNRARGLPEKEPAQNETL